MHPADRQHPANRQPAVTLSDDERQPCEIWTRVMGYHRPMSSFNTGKKGEFHERRYFRESTAGLAAPQAHPIPPTRPAPQAALSGHAHADAQELAEALC